MCRLLLLLLLLLLHQQQQLAGCLPQQLHLLHPCVQCRQLVAQLQQQSSSLLLLLLRGPRR
jgi:cytidine deaminase